MSLIVSRHQATDELRCNFARGLQQVFDVALALRDRGDELINIIPNKDEYPVTVLDIELAKANRDRYTRDGVRYEPLPALND
jgi:hypothetical protein